MLRSKWLFPFTKTMDELNPHILFLLIFILLVVPGHFSLRLSVGILGLLVFDFALKGLMGRFK